MITYPNVKVNLGLSVLRKRSDGYHDLETLFVPCLDICDTLEIIPGDDFSRTSASLFEKYSGVPEVPVPQDDRLSIRQGIREDGKLMITIARKEGVDWEPLEDLTARAYGLLDADFDLPPVKIFLEKTAPVGAGLGGGSADAAFALRMLSELFALGLDEAALAAYAARLGSDCAFFIYNRSMIGTGRGEVLEPYNVDLSQYELRVTVPAGVSVSTADAYRGIVPREAAACCAPSLREALARPAAEWSSCLVNDFEATVFAKYPAVAEAKQALYDAGAIYASMSGSGSAVFGLFPR
ncbi:MAG: 4-(cytidine 5'-diphospho)-2-C-methyl-D-erythritol kinase [Bacteroidales bacterium]|nr:4-(cytidine 5'-diphospho)-2-C-methyl-D-erythritol kinase [Bacteroidales bacterium]